MSIAFLFVSVTAVAASGFIAVMQLWSKLEHSPPSFAPQTSENTGDSAPPVYKMGNFAYLEATSSELKNYTMHWAPVTHGAGNSVGSNFLFNADQNLLKPKTVGTYFIYVELNLTCTFECSAGLLSVQVGDKLTCEVKLPAVANSMPESRKCWTVSQIDGQGLLTQMTVPKTGLENWKLELSGSGLGMFLVG
ncbi:uncharacterized protein [Pempheris klunzingeri]|uniref:uncharacterized protein n=1 Tax=Pempheris klunzingeri TaxID=3127111 RepID=UPI00397EE70B